MARLGPFEINPKIAVAVSGGADSMALLHLGAEWAREQGGAEVAFTLDHGLRAESAEEARQVALWSEALGVRHEILVWENPEPAQAAVQERARQARYRLLGAAAQSQDILHILVAHHADDQAETLLMRMSHDSGEDGLAGMAAIVELPQARVLRPLLTVPKARLIATCEAREQAWLEDPSNHNERFERVRVRHDHDKSLAEKLLAEAPGHAKRRAERESETAAFLARHATVSPTGSVAISLDPWQTAPQEISRRSLMQAIRTVGGEAYVPRQAQQEALLSQIEYSLFKQTTLGGCLIKKTREKLIIAQEKRGRAVKKPYLPHYPLGPARFPVV